MQEIRPADLPGDAAYKLLCGLVVPRPIAWVSTMSADGVSNLAPFSCFTFVSHTPPMLGVSIGRRENGLKDTARNIHETQAFVVHIGDETLLDPLHRSGGEFPPEVSEADLLGLELVPSRLVAPLRVAKAPIAMECRLHKVVDFGRNQFFAGEIHLFHIREDLITGTRIDAGRLRPVARLGGPNYSTLGEIIGMAPQSESRAEPAIALNEHHQEARR
ncbi:flavin reductase family protein [Ferrovibrio sp.]|uniref:flavin reductase family protein n=1 Tax=Ferrovibrio sp. TaxID=1917215 RepID=UPI000CB8BFA7|nr:flavin reductase family protein [Ferrovibrio sp.]PJI39551.1 MAG: flavin reductase [Ferrovibrio sp.]